MFLVAQTDGVKLLQDVAGNYFVASVAGNELFQVAADDLDIHSLGSTFDAARLRGRPVVVM